LLVRKALITAAARSQRELPLQTLIDGEGNKKSLLCILIEQSLAAGAEEIAVVVWPGDEVPYAQAAGAHASSVRFIPQHEPRGYGHAIHCARSFTERRPLSAHGGRPSLRQHRPKAFGSAPGGTGAKGAVLGERRATHAREPAIALWDRRRPPRSPRNDLYRVDTVIEKPTPTEAEQRLLVPGIRAGYYLCFFGIHVLTPAVMEILDRSWPLPPPSPVTLVDALAELARQEQYLAVEDEGRRYDLGAPTACLIAQLALALNGRDRGEVLSQMLELLADRELAGNGGGASS
jgi:UTP--glucose-1-phosphate uridylyltransferase